MNTPFRNTACCRGLPKATVFRALRSKLGGRPLPAAGGQPRRCTGARPNPFFAVGSKNFLLEPTWEKTPLASTALSSGFKRGIHEYPEARRARRLWDARPPAGTDYLSSDL